MFARTVAPAERLAALLALALLALGLASSGGAARAGGVAVRFSAVPQKVVQGDVAVVRVSVRPNGVSCTLTVRYADGGVQPDLKPARAANGRAGWMWRVPQTAHAGAAKVSVSCGRVGRASRSMLIVGALLPPKIAAEKQGFSVRPELTGASVSYGVVLRNESSTQDALKIMVLVNFVTADNVLIGSATKSITGIPAGSHYNLGGSLSFPGAAPVSRLEVVIQVGAAQPRQLKSPPLANIRVVPSPFDPGWVGSIEGELINDQPTLVLASAQLSTVVFDASGEVLGGGLGTALATLPPGTREFFKIGSGLRPIPIDRAVSAEISVEPTYKLPGA